MTPADREQRAHALVAALRKLGAAEFDVCASVAEGLILGEKGYGALDINADPRDFRDELIAELRDAVAYAHMELLREKAKRRALADAMTQGGGR